MANACSLFQDGGPHVNDCTTSGNDATAITGDDAIFSDRFSHFLSLYLRLLVFHHCCREIEKKQLISVAQLIRFYDL